MSDPVSTQEQVVRIERPTAGVAVVVLDRPARLNAMNPSSIPVVTQAVRPLADDPETRVVILTGAGRGFCTGMDLSSLDEMAPREVNATIAWMRELHSFSGELARLPQPTIAAVNGPAIGGGLGMALGCDLRIAGPDARFGATFARMALGPDAGVSHTLPAAVGHAAALDLLLSCEPIGPDAALRLGLVSRVAEDALAASIELAERWARIPAHASRTIKKTMQLAAGTDIETTLLDIEPRAQADLICHPDFFTNAEAWLAGHH
ncbi:enoyl-CoA hydratase/isomerase family protein [Nocardia violaceofusca]|uniref:enoyl-CoA hydratase/isomerase family protein n=1 Tax=Nocardia violaceofusca TaxID=941182 RepID=UPI000B0B8DC1|nr:enoyl-CoA hydratase/isomerase family protein [Nocardia violaceofusca]